jgi:hypothetical protein
MLEAGRVLRPDGKMILFESLGTGIPEPRRLDHLGGYYDWLDQEGFDSTVISTDYRFDSVEQAAGLLGCYFGTEMELRVRERASVVVPESTGVWWRNRS